MTQTRPDSARQRKLEYVVANVIEPDGRAPGEVFLPFIGGLVERQGWYSYDQGRCHADARSAAVESGEDRVPRGVVRIDEGVFCSLDLVRFARAADPVPETTLRRWAEEVLQAEWRNGIALVDGLFFAVDDSEAVSDAATAYVRFEKPVRIRRSGGKACYFDLGGRRPVRPPSDWPRRDAKIRRVRYDPGRGLLTWPDGSLYALPAKVLRSLPPPPPSAPPERCLRIVGDGTDVVVYLHDLYDATPSCTLVGMRDDLYVLETSRGVRLATHIPRQVEKSSNVMVMSGGRRIGWIDLALTAPPATARDGR